MIYNLIDKIVSGKLLIILLLITEMVYGVMVFITIPHLNEISGNIQIFDLKPLGYSVSYARDLLNALGQQGRSYYLYRQLPLDIAYPALYGMTFTLILRYVFHRAFKARNNWRWLVTLPLVAATFDYLENAGIFTMLTTFPVFSSGVAEITNIFTILKSVTSTFFYILLLVGLVVWGIRAKSKA